MAERSAAERKAREGERQVALIAEMVGHSHPEVPEEVLEDMAEQALAKTEDAPVQGLRIPLAQHDVGEQASAWERSRGTDGN
jgi:hypothetical protein